MTAMIIISRYTVEQEGGAAVARVRALNAPFCPSCGTLCSGYDTRLRRMIGDDGRVVVYRLRRVRCPACDTIHLELPNFMRPRKHYAAAVIDAVLTGGGDGCPADSSTMWRWRQKNHPPGLQCVSGEDVVQSGYSDSKGDEQ